MTSTPFTIPGLCEQDRRAPVLWDAVAASLAYRLQHQDHHSQSAHHRV